MNIETKPIIEPEQSPQTNPQTADQPDPFHGAALPQTGTLKERTSEAERSIIAGTLEAPDQMQQPQKPPHSSESAYPHFIAK